MKRFSTLVFAVLLGTLHYFSSPAGARVVFQDDFQSQSVGAVVHNALPPIGEGYYWLGANHYGYFDDNTTNPPGGAAGAKFVGGLPSLAGYGQQNLVITTADELAVTNKVVRFSLDAYVVGTVAQNYGLDISTLASGGVYVGRAWDIDLQTDGTLAVYDNSGYHVVPGGIFRTDTWVPVEVVADYSAGTFQATVDGSSFGGNFSADPGNNTFRRVSIGEAGYSPAFIDNVLVTVSSGVPGDYNDDGTVDAADYVVWRKGGPLANEVDNPETVNAQDYTEWRTRFGNISGSGLSVGTVPEPASALLVLLTSLATVASWRGCSRS